MKPASYRLQCLVDDTWVLEVIVGIEVELVQEIPNVDTAERVHLRERKDAREPGVS